MAYIDLLTRIKNAQAAKKEFLKTPFSKMDLAIAEILAKYNFVAAAEKRGRLPKAVIELKLKYDQDNKASINGLKLISRPSRRFYVGYKDLKPVKNGYGLGVISTSGGIMTTNEARKKKLGGELLFEIW